MVMELSFYQKWYKEGTVKKVKANSEALRDNTLTELAFSSISGNSSYCQS
jgi:hypothetical protein